MSVRRLESGAEDMSGALHVYKSSNSSETKAVFQERGEAEQGTLTGSIVVDFQQLPHP